MSELRKSPSTLYDLEPTQTFRLKDGVDIQLDKLEERARDLDAGDLAGFGTIFDPNAGGKKNSNTRVKVNMSSDGLALFDTKTKISHRWASKKPPDLSGFAEQLKGLMAVPMASVTSERNPFASVRTDWQAPKELPDLRRVGTISIDLETKDDGIREGRGSSWPWRGGHISGINIGWSEEGDVRAIYAPMRHPDSDNFDPVAVHQWIKDHIAAGLVFTTKNAVYDWGWLRTEAGIVMPPPKQIVEIDVLAAHVDENQFDFSLDAIAKRCGLAGKDETLLNEAVLALVLASGKKLGKKKLNTKEYLWQLPARFVGPYAEGDAIATLLIPEKLYPIIDAEGTRAACDLDRDLLAMVLEMRLNGIRVNEDSVVQARDQILVKRDAALKELSAQHGAGVSMDEINSPEWKERAFKQYGLTTPKLTPKKGKMSFAKGGGKDGWMTKHKHWLPRLIATASKYDGAACKFLEGHILKHIVNGRIHSEMHILRSEDGGARSSRFSYSDPPLQQMPSRDPELGPLIRGCFEAEDNESWCDPDAS
jgi:hypothetical protein